MPPSLLASALANSNTQAFLRVIRAGEGTSDEDGYRRHFGGELFSDFSAHPNRAITKSLGGKPITSTAAGAYQFLHRTWEECRAALGLSDFSPASQDLAAVFLINRRKALDDVLNGNFEQAIALCAKEWASLPGWDYGQPTKSLAECKRIYESFGGKYAPTQPSEEIKMPLPIAGIAAALLPTLIESIPKLGKLFSSGSAVAERNQAAVETVLEIVTTATNSVNAQAAVESIKANPVAKEAAEKAIEENWFKLSEVGGGIEEARKADIAFITSGEPVWKSPSFIIAIALLPLVYLIVGAVVGLFGAAFSEDVRAAIANGVIGLILGGLIGYYYGQSTSRNRTPAVQG